MGVIKHDPKMKYLYKTWKGMNYRCDNENATGYKWYGGKGIRVCEEWSDKIDGGFERFCKDVHPRPEGMTLDRIDGDKDYCKSNCRWATNRDQGANISSNKVLEWEGQSYILRDLAEKYNIKANTLLYRLRRGSTLKQALGLEKKPVKYIPTIAELVVVGKTAEIDTLHDKGASTYDISYILGITRYSVHKYLKSVNKIHQKYITDCFGKEVKVGYSFKLNDVNIRHLVKLKLEGLSNRAIARDLKVSGNAIQGALNKIRFKEYYGL